MCFDMFSVDRWVTSFWGIFMVLSSKKMLEKYSQALNERPILTKAATSATLYALQEIIASTVARTPTDAQKALKMTLYGMYKPYIDPRVFRFWTTWALLICINGKGIR